MLGKSLLLPRFFFLVSTLDTVEGLESVLTEETMLVVLDLFFCDQPWEFSSSWLKYSISCIRRDPTVPLVPISTGGNSAISFVLLVARMVGVCMLYFVGVKEKAKLGLKSGLLFEELMQSVTFCGPSVLHLFVVESLTGAPLIGVGLLGHMWKYAHVIVSMGVNVDNVVLEEEAVKNA
ncbi:hypothetical protein VNO80_30344 [Phaseolus coccineus]|uniref:Uncharacterized protein n=1 Tax=Phaseolus coccineus TaxID=3886 RepID=A0AAN9LD21_PHACN